MFDVSWLMDTFVLLAGEGDILHAGQNDRLL